MSDPELQAVVEVPLEAPSFLMSLPARPWPAHVRLNAAASPGDVALLVAQLASYGRGACTSFAEILDAFPVVLPGGLAVVHDGLVILPSCCCGLEGWRDWGALLEEGTSPWLGHDPTPWVEVEEDTFVVWADNASPWSDTVRFTSHQLKAALRRAEDDLRAFVNPLRAWLAERDPASAGAIADRFSETFVMPGDRPA